MTRIICILTTAMMALLLAGPAQALHCNGNITTIETAAGTFYIDDRSDTAGEINHWTYLEDNGVEGLQSGSYYMLFPCPEPNCGEKIPFWFFDPCNHLEPDVYIF